MDNGAFTSSGEAALNPIPATFLRLTASLLACGALAGTALAQEKKPTPPPAKQAAAKPAGTAQKAAPTQKRTGPPPTTAAQMAALPHADEEQRQAATLVHYGKYVCDEKFEVFVERNPIFDGYVDVRYKKDVWVMKPVASNTGAVRLEDTRGAVLLVQIPVKSMLLNTRTGQRIVDSCQHANQREAESQAKADAAAQAQPARQ
jgi:hypothetical protein